MSRANASPVGRSHPENVGSGDRERIPRGVVAVRRGIFRLGYHPGALRHPSCPRRGAGISNSTTTPGQGVPTFEAITSFFADFVYWPLRLACPVRRSAAK